jgi:hypothetical protein
MVARPKGNHQPFTGLHTHTCIYKSKEHISFFFPFSLTLFLINISALLWYNSEQKEEKKPKEP